jgi:hypothetical protein
VLAVLALVTAAVLAGAWRVSASQSATQTRPVTVASRVTAPRPRLAPGLQQWLAVEGKRPPFALPGRGLPVPLPNLAPGAPGSCFVAGRCSEVPCVEFAQSTPEPTATAVVQASVVVLERPTPAPFNGGSQPGSSCAGRLGTPRILRVSGP